LLGHRKSQPVRVGNAASEQMQLDVYGELVEAVSHFFGKTEELDRDVRGMLHGIGEYVCEHWREYDNGIWEERDELRPYTHSRLMCWVALDRLLQMHARDQIPRLDAARCAAERENIRKEIEQRAWNPQLAGYAQACGSDIMDATVLLFPYHGFESAASQRMQETYARVRERLVPRRGLVYRYEKSKDRHEGAFAVCSFWEVDFLARAGKAAEAREVFEAALGYANDVDLFAEEIEPDTGEAMGNFPQAFTHLGVINAALALRDRAETEH
jgi:GH15 family glucan-1,4-alpha-glucosidase